MKTVQQERLDLKEIKVLVALVVTVGLLEAKDLLALRE